MSSPQFTRRQAFQGAALTVGALALAACSSDDDATSGDGEKTEAELLGLNRNGLLVGPLDKPTVVFTDQDGQPYNIAEKTAGKLTLLFFGYTSCPDQCPVYLNNIAAALEKLDGPAQKTNVLFVGTDTARDTPEVLKEYLGKKNPEYVGLTATPEEIDDVLASLLLPSVTIPEDTSGNYTVGHPLNCVVFTPDNLCHIMYPYGLRQSEWATEIDKLTTFTWPESESR